LFVSILTQTFIMQCQSNGSPAKGVYESGIIWNSSVPITTKTMVRLIEELNKLFGEGYEFVPEAISGGGILMKNWPNKTVK